MKSQVAKRVNVNLTEKNVREIEILQKWYKTVDGKKELSQSDIIRAAIDYYFFDTNLTLKYKGQKMAKEYLEQKPTFFKANDTDDNLPF